MFSDYYVTPSSPPRCPGHDECLMYGMIAVEENIFVDILVIVSWDSKTRKVNTKFCTISVRQDNLHIGSLIIDWHIAPVLLNLKWTRHVWPPLCPLSVSVAAAISANPSIRRDYQGSESLHSHLLVRWAVVSHLHLDTCWQSVKHHGVELSTATEWIVGFQCPASFVFLSAKQLVLQCSDCQKTYAKKFLRPYFLRRNKQGNKDCWKLWNEISFSDFSCWNALIWYTIHNILITEFWGI